MSWTRHHFHCEACDGTWLVEEDVVTADCPFCAARDVFAYRTEIRGDAAELAKTLAATMRKAAAKPAPRAAEKRRLRRAS